MAAVFTTKKEQLGLIGGAQAKMYGEVHRVHAGTANTAGTVNLQTSLHQIRAFSVGVNGTATMPYLDEYDNTDGDLVIRGSASDVILRWATAPKGTKYYVTFFGF